MDWKKLSLEAKLGITLLVIQVLHFADTLISHFAK
jgi:hypothetical protein